MILNDPLLFGCCKIIVLMIININTLNIHRMNDLRILKSIVILLAVAIVAFSFSSGVPEGHTGAPGEVNCTSCHQTHALNSGDGSLSITVSTAAYTPGEVYEVTVEVMDDSLERAGFQLTALDENLEQAGTITDFNEEVLELNNADGRQYIYHIDASDQNSWSFQWQAPETNRGEVTFYAAGNAANGDFSNDGDYIYTDSLAISADEVTALTETAHDLPTPLQVYPTHVSNEITIDYTLDTPGHCRIELMNADGKPVAVVLDKNQHTGSYIATYETESLSPGVYYVNYITDSNTASKRIIIL